jgi:hypothetical protein
MGNEKLNASIAISLIIIRFLNKAWSWKRLLKAIKHTFIAKGLINIGWSIFLQRHEESFSQ